MCVRERERERVRDVRKNAIVNEETTLVIARGSFYDYAYVSYYCFKFFKKGNGISLGCYF